MQESRNGRGDAERLTEYSRGGRLTGRYARGSARDAAAYSVVQALLRSKSVHLQPAREAPPLPHPFKPVLLITDHLNLIKQTSRYDGFATAVFIDLACPVGAASHLIYASLVRAPLKAQSALPVRPNPAAWEADIA